MYFVQPDVVNNMYLTKHRGIYYNQKKAVFTEDPSLKDRLDIGAMLLYQGVCKTDVTKMLELSD